MSMDARETAAVRVAKALGDRVAVLLPNTPQYFIAELGAWKIGAILVPLNPIYTEEELLGPLKDTAPKVVVTLTSTRIIVAYSHLDSPSASTQTVVVAVVAPFVPGGGWIEIPLLAGDEEVSTARAIRVRRAALAVLPISKRRTSMA